MIQFRYTVHGTEGDRQWVVTDSLGEARERMRVGRALMRDDDEARIEYRVVSPWEPVSQYPDRSMHETDLLALWKERIGRRGLMWPPRYGGEEYEECWREAVEIFQQWTAVRVAELEDILSRASRLAESEQAQMAQQVIQEAWEGEK